MSLLDSLTSDSGQMVGGESMGAYSPQRTYSTNTARDADAYLASSLPAAFNVRNKYLQNTLNEWEQDPSSLIRSSLADQFSNKFDTEYGQSRAMLAARGLLGGGAEQDLMNKMMQQMAGGYGSVEQQTTDQEAERKNALLRRLFGMSTLDTNLMQGVQNYYEPSSRQQLQQYTDALIGQQQGQAGNITGKFIKDLFTMGMMPGPSTPGMTGAQGAAAGSSFNSNMSTGAGTFGAPSGGYSLNM